MLLATSVLAQDWSPVVDKAVNSILRLEIASDGQLAGSCSAAILDSQQGFVLTAAHCVPTQVEGRSLTVNNKHAEVEKVDYVLDLAVFQVDGLDGTAIEIGSEDAKVGQPVAIAGYAFGAEHAMFTFGHVADVVKFPTHLLLDAVVIPGQSGGMVIDSDGRLIGTVQATLFAGPAGQSSHLGLSANTKTVRAFAKKYIAPKKAQ
jgi:S1-C subfamily serine protease